MQVSFLFLLQTRRSSSTRGNGNSPNGSSSSKRKLSNCAGANGSSNSSSGGAPDNAYEPEASASNCKIGRQRSSASIEGEVIGLFLSQPKGSMTEIGFHCKTSIANQKINYQSVVQINRADQKLNRD